MFKILKQQQGSEVITTIQTLNCGISMPICRIVKRGTLVNKELSVKNASNVEIFKSQSKPIFLPLTTTCIGLGVIA